MPSPNLLDLEVLAIDCQTTGATPRLGHVIEIGWTRVVPSREEAPLRAHLVALPEGERIPRMVSRITGIDAAAMEGALPPGEAFRHLAQDARAAAPAGGPAPGVIHFARFELNFLRDWQERFEPGAPLAIDVVCLHEIARRLFPDLPRRGLRALAGYFGHGVDLSRRSPSHVAATALVWRHTVRELAARGVREWKELRPWLEEPAPPASKRRVYPLPRERIRELPAGPGVYRMLRSNGDVLYVGKALSLKHRVGSHFTQGRTTERALEMLTQARDLDITPTATALEAALLETDEIKRLDPPYNVHLRVQGRAASFASPDWSVVSDRPQAKHWIGPLPSGWLVRPLAAVRALVLGSDPTPEERARAVGAPPQFAPEPEVFRAGWEAFAARYLAPVRSRTPWGRVWKASKVLWRLFGEGALEEGGEETGTDRRWDADRVRRHLERVVLGAGQLVRRARWMCLLADANVAYRDVGSAARRLLVVSAGNIVEARDLAAAHDVPPPEAMGRPWLERQRLFDASLYDRLRVLTTELKRVHAEDHYVAVRLDARPPIEGERLGRLLRWV